MSQAHQQRTRRGERCERRLNLERRATVDRLPLEPRAPEMEPAGKQSTIERAKRAKRFFHRGLWITLRECRTGGAEEVGGWRLDHSPPSDPLTVARV